MAADHPPPPQLSYTIGYALTPKKQSSFIQPSLLSLAQSRNIHLTPIDPTLPLSPQGPFHAIIHKLSDPLWTSHLHAFSLAHPSIPIIDPPQSISSLHNRHSMLQVVSTLPPTSTPLTFGVPRQALVLDLPALASPPASLHFPLIAKPILADGSLGSHNMSLVFRPQGLTHLQPPLVLQEFTNHGGVIFKVYVVGDFVRCVKRKSLPDVSEDHAPDEEAALAFSQVSNMSATTGRSEEGYYETMHLEDAEMPPVEFLTEIAHGLRRAMGLHLFNFDVIRDVKAGNHYLVIDINYFPGYAKMPGYETVLTDFFWDIVHQKQDLDMLSGGDDQEKKELCNSHSDGVEDKEMENIG